MPLSQDAELTILLANGRIAALTVDTNIFVEKNLQLKSTSLQAITSIRKQRFDFILSGTVKKEVQRHLERAATEALRSARKSLGTALAAFDTQKPTRDEILEAMTGGQSAEVAAASQLDDYIIATECRILDDTAMVDTATIYDAYFSAKPPFSSGAKKSEFPDALALNALERYAEQANTNVLLVSKDGDWRSFCETSTRLYLVADIERALSLINDPPVVLKETVQAHLLGEGDEREDLLQYIERATGQLEFSVEGYSSAGMEIHAWDAELRGVGWPEPEEIDIIEVEEHEGGLTVLTVSVPILLEVEVPVEVEFSTWDSIDRETVGLGGRMIDIKRDLDIRATVRVSVENAGKEDEVLGILECELDDTSHEIDLGEVRVFEEEHD